MSTLQTKSFTSIVGSIAAGMQGRISSRFLNFAIGTMLRGVAEAYAGVALWLQYNIIQVAKLTRLTTSFGPDIDSFLADFPLSGVTRLGAQAASGPVTFSRYTAGPAPVYVPVGTTVKSSDGSLQYVVTADTSNVSFVPSFGTSGGYVIPAAVSSVSAPVVCTTISPNATAINQFSGANGNAASGLISLISSAVPGVDTVTNPAAFTNGFDVESDAGVKARFLLAVQGRGGGTVASITSAIANLKIGMQSTIQIGVDYNGAADLGMVTIVIDDGSGATPVATVNAAATAVADNVIGVRAAGVRTTVTAATTTLANVTATIVTLPGYVHNTVVAAVVAALGLQINGTGLGNALKYSRLYAVAQGVAGVDEITAFTLNGAAADLPANPITTYKAGSLVVS